MELRTKCPYCGQKYDIDDSFIGRTVKCECCYNEFVVEKTFRAFRQSKPSAKTSVDSLPKENNYSPKGRSPNTGTKTSADYNRTAKVENWIKDFFDFRVMITPTLVRLSFLFFFVGSSLAILAFPFKADNMSTGSRFLLFFVILLMGIPIWAIILHTLYELTMVPFLILENLIEIRNKLDETTKS